jgi:hypothetical protein
VKNNPNTPDLAFSNFDQPHKIVGMASYSVDYLKHGTTSLSIIYTGSQGGRYSYSYSGDLNRDGISGNDLIYVPQNPSEIILIADNAADTRTPAEIWTQLDAYIKQDPYLNSHRGQIVDRNHSLLPFVHQFDLRVAQDLYLNVAGKKNTLQFTCDLINFGNLLNSSWGVSKSVNKYSFLQFRNLTGPGGAPRFSFNYFNSADKIVLTETLGNSFSLISRWQLQLGIRYIFN